MAYSRKKVKQDGTIFFEITATRNRNEKVSKSWTPPPGWSQKSIMRELKKQECSLQQAFDNHEILTVAEKAEQARLEALEKARLINFRDFCESVYLPEISLTTAENTFSCYESKLRIWIYPRFEKLKLRDINTGMIQSLLLEMQRAGLGIGSRRAALIVLRGIFGRAVDLQLIDVNPAAAVKLRKSKNEEKAKNRKFLTASDVKTILSYVDNNESLMWRAFFHLAFDSGMRINEICALEWADIDFSAGKVEVSKTIIESHEKGRYTTPPKSGKSRIVFCSPQTLKLLKTWRREQGSICLSRNIFTIGTVEPIWANTADYHIKKISKAVDIQFHAHDMRHATASIALQAGGDLSSVSSLLGHSDVSITARTYIHADASRVEAAAKAGWTLLAASSGEK